MIYGRAGVSHTRSKGEKGMKRTWMELLGVAALLLSACGPGGAGGGTGCDPRVV